MRRKTKSPPKAKKKEHTLLSGEKLSLKELSKEEKSAIKKLRRRIKKDPNGDNEGEYFILSRLISGPGAILVKYRRVNPRITYNETCYRVMRDIATRAGIRQGLILNPKYREEGEKFETPKWPIISFAQSAKRLGITYSKMRELLEKGEIEGKKLGNCWVVNFNSVENYRKRRKNDKQKTTQKLAEM